MPNIVVGMDNRINAVKQILLQNDVDRLGITGMGANHLTVSVFMVRVGFFMPSGWHARWAWKMGDTRRRALHGCRWANIWLIYNM